MDGDFLALPQIFIIMMTNLEYQFVSVALAWQHSSADVAALDRVPGLMHMYYMLCNTHSTTAAASTIIPNTPMTKQ